MIKTKKHHKIIYPIFQWLSRFLINRNFNSVIINGQFPDNGKSVLIIANHISWWDGFWVMLLNLNVIHRKFHFMMLENQLKKYWYFQYAGGYSVKKKSRTVLESINHSVKLLQQSENLVLIFPQGQIHSMYNNVLHFEKGIERIIKAIMPETQIVFVANLIDYFADKKPNLYIYFRTLLAKEIEQSDIETVYNAFFNEVMNTQKNKIL